MVISRLIPALVMALSAILAVGVPAALAGDSPYRLLHAPALPSPPFDYSPQAPVHMEGLAPIDSTPQDNPVTNAGATLGRVLFHDRQLSRNGLVACASCHTQAVGFDDPTRLSIGFAGKVTRRASMSLANARYNPGGRHFRDERAATLEEQVLEPFVDPIEMGLEPGELVYTVSKRSFYRPLFAAAFGDQTVSDDRIARALAQYVRSIVSYRSFYDAERAKASDRLAPFAGFTAAQNRGKELFLRPPSEGGAGCASCHETEAFVLLSPRNNGLDGDTGTDDGLGEITHRREDLGRFRTASLRNVAVSSPYMHDGRFADLEAVIAHYSDGVADHPNLSRELRGADGKPRHLGLGDADKAALVAFLETLTDEELLTDQRFSDPFLAR